MDLWNYSLFNNILLVTYESHFSLNWLISLESHITLNFLFYFLNVPNRLSGIVQIRVTVVSWTWCAFLVLFIDVHSIDTLSRQYSIFLSWLLFFCLWINEIHTTHIAVLFFNNFIWCSVLLRSSKGFHNTNILMWIESSRAPATISLDFCTSSIFSAAKLFISCYFFSCSLIQPYTLTIFITCCIVYVCHLG